MISITSIRYVSSAKEPCLRVRIQAWVSDWNSPGLDALRAHGRFGVPVLQVTCERSPDVRISACLWRLKVVRAPQRAAGGARSRMARRHFLELRLSIRR